MPLPPNNFARLDPSVLHQLACPSCLGELMLVEDILDCESCGRTYPIVDGIPVLIAHSSEIAIKS